MRLGFSKIDRSPRRLKISIGRSSAGLAVTRRLAAGGHSSAMSIKTTGRSKLALSCPLCTHLPAAEGPLDLASDPRTIIRRLNFARVDQRQQVSRSLLAARRLPIAEEAKSR